MYRTPSPRRLRRRALLLWRRRWPLFAGLGVLLLLAAAALAPRPTTEIVSLDGPHRWHAAEAPPRRQVVWQPAEPVAPPIAHPELADSLIRPFLDEQGTVLYATIRDAEGRAAIHRAELRGGRWQPLAPVEALNSEGDTIGPVISPDGRELYLYSNREGGFGGFDLYVAERTEEGWSAPRNLGPRVNSPAHEYDPAITPDGRRLLFSSNRSPRMHEALLRQRDEAAARAWSATLRADLGLEKFDLYSSLREPGGEWRPADPLHEVNLPEANEGGPVISPSGAFVYFVSDRAARPGEQANFDLYRARIREQGISQVENLGPGVNTPANELEPALSEEGFRLYFSRNRLAEGDPAQWEKYELYVSQAAEIETERAWDDSRLATLLALLEGLNWWWLLLALLLLALLAGLLWFARQVTLRRASVPGFLLAALILHFLLGTGTFFVYFGEEIAAEIRKAVGPPIEATQVDLFESQRAPETSESAFAEVADLAAPQTVEIPELTRQTTQSPAAPAPAEAPVPPADARVVFEPLPAPAPSAEPRTLEPLRAEQPQLARAQPRLQTPQELIELETAAPAAPASPESLPETPRLTLPRQPLAAAETPLPPVETAAAEAPPARPTAEPLSTESAPTAEPPAASSRASAQPLQLARRPAQRAAADSVPVETPSVNSPAAPSEAPPPTVEVAAARSFSEGSISPTAANLATTLPAENSAPLSPEAPPSNSVMPAPLAPTPSRTFAAPLPARALVTPPSIAEAPAEIAEIATPSGAAAPAPFAPALPAAEVRVNRASDAVQVTLAPAAEPDSAPTDLPQRLHPAAEAESLPAPTAAPATSAGGVPSPLARRPAVGRGAPAVETAVLSQVEGSAPAVEAAAGEAVIPRAEVALARAEPGIPSPSPAADSVPTTQTGNPGRVPRAEVGDAASDAPAAPAPVRGGLLGAVPARGKPLATRPTDETIPLETPAAGDAAAGEPETLAALPGAEVRLNRAAGEVQVALAPSPREPGGVFQPAGPRLHLGRLGPERIDAPPTVGRNLDPLARRGNATRAPRYAEDSIRLQALLRLRKVDEDAKRKLLEEYGADDRTLEAIARGLSWIKAHQREDGSWSLHEFHHECKNHEGKPCDGRGNVRSSSAATGFALLPFLGDGHTHLAGEHREVVARGVAYLLAQQKRDGDPRKDGELYFDNPNDNARMYSHGLATIALCEAYAMSGDESLREPAQRAVNFIVHAQEERSGGWRYQPRQGGDTSVVGWQVMALKSAQMGDLRVPQPTLDRARLWIQGVSGKESRLGEFAYQGGNYSPTMSAEALLCLEYLGGQRSDPEILAGGDYLMRHLPAKGKESSYYWYYGTQAVYHLQGEHWKRWSDALNRFLIDTQETEGSLAGMWKPQDHWERQGGAIMSTSLRLLMLEVSYRHLPLFKVLNPEELATGG